MDALRRQSAMVTRMAQRRKACTPGAVPGRTAGAWPTGGRMVRLKPLLQAALGRGCRGWALCGVRGGACRWEAAIMSERHPPRHPEAGHDRTRHPPTHPRPGQFRGRPGAPFRRRMVGPFIFFDRMGPRTSAGAAGGRRPPAPAHRPVDHHHLFDGEITTATASAPAAGAPRRGELDDRRRGITLRALRAPARRRRPMDGIRPGSPCPPSAVRPGFWHYPASPARIRRPAHRAPDLRRLLGLAPPVDSPSSTSTGAWPPAPAARRYPGARCTSPAARSRSPASAWRPGAWRCCRRAMPSPSTPCRTRC